ncbi:hypothetical protein L2E82_18506 [Cichorium intybus]|uniref:Uncharacterized protein n=1 Tax=Cichorium intybus TaxID=13427 RepID=A0ACB9F9X4_CICIN|nr:hypothetical protein L2E82_18506 [Cichorium intybus]
MKLLRPKRRREKHRVTFFSGFFSGCSIALLIAVILLIQAKKVMTKEEHTMYIENVFHLYRSFFPCSFVLSISCTNPVVSFSSNVYSIAFVLLYTSVTTRGYIVLQLFKLTPEESSKDPQYFVLLRHLKR